MQNFIVIFREPDGRTVPHTAEEISRHQLHWKEWLAKWGQAGKLNGGSALTLNGRMLKGRKPEISNGIHQVGSEIIGGFLLLKAEDMEEATAIVQSCPVFEFDGYAEIREMQQ